MTKYAAGKFVNTAGPMYGGMDDDIKSSHNIKATQATIKELLKFGTPNWVKRPRRWPARSRATRSGWATVEPI